MGFKITHGALGAADPLNNFSRRQRLEHPSEWENVPFSGLEYGMYPFKPFKRGRRLIVPYEKPLSAKHTLQLIEKNYVEQSLNRKDRFIDDFRPGDSVIVEAYSNLKEINPSLPPKVDLHKGVIIGIRNKGYNTRFHLRCLMKEEKDWGYEMFFPLYSPVIKSITVVGCQKRYKRSKLYFLKKIDQKWSRFFDTRPLSEREPEIETPLFDMDSDTESSDLKIEDEKKENTKLEKKENTKLEKKEKKIKKEIPKESKKEKMKKKKI